MATTVLSGRQLVLTIDATDYSDQILSANLSITTERLTFDTISGKAYKYIDKDATLDIEFLNDVGAASSLTEALWNATETAADTGLAAVLTVASGETYSFNVLPSFPPQGGAASDGQQVSVSLQVSGAITPSY